jgi:hypothetical protein
MSLAVEIFGVAEVLGELNAFGDRLEDPRPGLSRMVDELLELNRRTFADGQRGAWPELSPRYAAEKARRGEPMMEASDELFDALTKRAGDTLELDRDGFRLGLRGRQQGRRLAARRRPVIRISTADRQRLTDGLRGWLRTGAL